MEGIDEFWFYSIKTIKGFRVQSHIMTIQSALTQLTPSLLDNLSVSEHIYEV